MNAFSPVFLIAALALLAHSAGCAPPDPAQERERMREAIERSAREAARVAGAPLISDAVLDAIDAVPRHEFVPDDLRAQAYANHPLPIGHGQTISQPYIVALMTELARVDRDAKVLEIGTGSGYQAAVLGELAGEVYTIEIVRALGLRARDVLERLGYDNVTVRVGDGYAGWPEHAPFDAIVVTAAPETVPAPLIEQLAVGGRLVIPVGPSGTQQLKVLTRERDGSVSESAVIPVLFVPFTREVR